MHMDTIYYVRLWIFSVICQWKKDKIGGYPTVIVLWLGTTGSGTTSRRPGLQRPIIPKTGVAGCCHRDPGTYLRP